MGIANWSLLAAGVALSTTACGHATTVGTDYEPSLDFGFYNTFAWNEAAILRTRDARLDDDPFFEDRLFEAVERELATRGIRHEESAPDLLLHYHLSVADHIDVFEAKPRWDNPRPEYEPGKEVVKYEQGTVVLHFVDPATDETLWIGWGQGDIGAALTESIKMREWVDGVVALMFEDFPILSTGTPRRW
jgi:hypothetical protein